MKRVTVYVLVLALALIPLSVVGYRWINAGESDKRLFSYAKNITLMRGHLRTALANSDAGDKDHAKGHAGHVMKEGNFSVIKEAIEAKDPGVAIQLRLALSDLSAVDHSSSRTREVMRLLEKALKVLVPKNKLEDPAFQARIMQALFGAVEDEYGDAVDAKGRLIELEEYQDAFGFMVEARVIYKGISNELGADSREIDEIFDELSRSFKNIAPPPKMVPANTVSATVDRLNQELSKVVGLPLN